MDGSGVTKAVLLAQVAAEDRAKQVAAATPARFARFASIDVTQPDAVDRLRAAAQNGAVGFGEIKSQVAAAGPEMQRVYALASELNVPITIHFQEVNQPGSPGTYNTGLKKFDAMLKAFPKTTFIGHADAFWANVSADYAEDTAYPKGPIVPGGVTDRLLGDYPNLYADMSANSGNNFLTRDPELAAAWANLLAARLNDHMRQRALAEAEANVKYLRREFESTSIVTLQQSISGLLENEMQKLMLARGNSEYAFRVIDRAEVPRAPSKPRVTLIVVLATAFGGMLSVLVVLLRDMVKNRTRVGPPTAGVPSGASS